MTKEEKSKYQKFVTFCMRERQTVLFNGYKYRAERMCFGFDPNGHEYLLFMYKGKLTPVAKEERGKIHTVFTEQVRKHSQKPLVAYEIIERLYPDSQKLEMYARNTRNNWDCWGNEAPEDN